jgi:hypothetical protein
MAYTTPAMKDRLGHTFRRDSWWATPSAMFLVFVGFVIYATIAAIINPNESAAGLLTTTNGVVQHVSTGGYAYDFDGAHFLSPFYSPNFAEIFPNARFFKYFPAFWVVWLPIAFRVTCYYGRKAYYRSILMNPAACAVGKGTDRAYNGETAFPWIINNIHRYFLYLIVVLVIFHWRHFYDAFHFEGGVGMSLGSLIIAADTILLTLYVGSCHSFRHLIGGNVDCFSCAKAGEMRYKGWKGISWLNQFHNAFFWSSLITVGFADLYVRLVAMGVWTDVRFF